MIYCIIKNILKNGGIKVVKETGNGKAKKVTRPKLSFTLLGWAAIIFGILEVYGMMSEYFRGISLGRIKAAGLIIIPIITILLSLVFVGAGVYLLKIIKNVYFYDDGFIYGKNTEKNLYKDLHYFFVPGLNVNTFQSIFYQTADGEYNIISGNFYRAKGFSQFQEDVVKVTYPSAMEKINSGEAEEFSFLSPRKNLLALGRKKISEKAKKLINEADKIKITKEYIAIADEIYRWDQHRISAKYGNIIVNGLNGEKIARLPRLRVDRPNLLEALVGTFNRN